MRIKKDLKEFVNHSLMGFVESHIEAWCYHYAGMSPDQAAHEFDINYDWSAELENIEDSLGRELTVNEEYYIFNKYLKMFKETFFESMQEGIRIKSGYYLKRG